MEKPSNSQEKRIVLITSGVFLILLIVYWGISSLLQKQLQESAYQTVSQDIYLYGANISNTLNQKLTLMYGLSAYTVEELLETEGFTNDDFEFFSEYMFESTSGVRNVAIAPGGVMEYVYPYEPNKDVIGYEPAQDERPSVREEVSQAIETRQIVLSTPYELIQGGTGLIARQAIFVNDDYWGLANIVIDIPALFEETGMQMPSNQIAIALYDQEGTLFYGDETVIDLDPVQYEVQLPDGSWTLLGAPANGWESLYRNTLSIFNLLAILLVFSIVLVVYMATSSNARLQQSVETRTAELRLTEEKLRKDIAVRERIKKENEKLLAQESQQRNLAETLSEVTLLFTSHTSTNQLLDEILTQIHRLVPFETANLALVEGDKIITKAVLGYTNQEVIDFLTDLEQDLNDMYYDELAIRTNSPVVIKDVHQAEHWLVIPETEWIKSFMSIPIYYRDEVLGLIRIDGKSQNMFDESDIEKLQPLANAAAIALNNARLHEQAQREIAERKKAEAQVRKLNNELEQRVEDRTAELVRMNKELEAFAYSISHDLRAPVRAIKGIAQLFEEEYASSMTDEGREYLSRITASGEKMNELIEGLLTLSYMGQRELTLQTLDLSQVAAK
ncbi:MAG TPA: GAF domain-containing protein, partial [Anaerolineales bacterium]|nr:GAF domain-containing protein [Anaerolineales bacterium]